MPNVNVKLAVNENANGTTEVLPLQINYVPQFVTKMAEEELNDSPDNRRKGLEQLKELLNVFYFENPGYASWNPQGSVEHSLKTTVLYQQPISTKQKTSRNAVIVSVHA
ncbi:uncharacterized protein TNCV_2429661 [Trichonephila clavipes]|nr:uncharacterized protein TNCV_2429661 [Trichonephila clavipes]